MRQDFAIHLLQSADPSIHLDGLSPDEVAREAESLAQFAVDSLNDGYDVPAEIVDGLTDRQVAQYANQLQILESYGQWSQNAGADGASYFPPDRNPYAIGDICCQNCVHWQEGSCVIVEGAIDPQGICRLWIIPEFVIEPFQNDTHYITDSVRTDGRVVKHKGLHIGITHEPGAHRFMRGRPMRASYGRINRSWGQSEDGKAIDAYLAPGFDPENDSNPVYQVMQRNPETGEEDERKMFFGYPDARSVRDAHIYHAGADRFGSVRQIDPAELDPYRKDAVYHADSCGCEACSTKRAKKKQKQSETEDPESREDADRRGLVAKKVEIQGKDGKTYKSTRWVKPENSKAIAIAGAGLLGAAAVGAGALALSQSGKGKDVGLPKVGEEEPIAQSGIGEQDNPPAEQVTDPQPSEPTVVAKHPNPIEEVNDQDFPYSMVIHVEGAEGKQEKIQEFLDALKNPEHPEARQKLANLMTSSAVVHKGKISPAQKSFFSAKKQVPPNQQSEYDSQLIYIGLSKKPKHPEHSQDALPLDRQDFFAHELPSIARKVVLSPRVEPEAGAEFYKKDSNDERSSHTDSCGCEACAAKHQRRKRTKKTVNPPEEDEDGIKTLDGESLTRSDADRKGLVAKKVKIKGKDGKTYESTRWVKPETALAVGASLLGAAAIGVGAIAAAKSVQGTNNPQVQQPQDEQSFQNELLKDAAKANGKPLTKEEEAAIANYRGSMYHKMNDLLLGKRSSSQTPEDVEVARNVQAAVSALRKLPAFTGKMQVHAKWKTNPDDAEDPIRETKELDLAGEPLHRYVGLNQEAFDNYKVGGEYLEPRFCSTTGQGYPVDANNTLYSRINRPDLGIFKIHYKKDGSSQGREIFNFEESEVLFPPGVKFKVKTKRIEHVETVKGQPHKPAFVVELEEL